MAAMRTVSMQQMYSAHLYARHVVNRTFSAAARVQEEHASRLPRVVSPSFWSSLIPKSWRNTYTPEEKARRAAERAVGASERRTGIIFLILGIVVGSNAIHLLNLKREMLNYTRHTEAKLATLREVIQRVKNGEDVDVKGLLGTGDPEQEKEWEQVIKELEGTDMLWEGRKKRDAEREQKLQKRAQAEEARKNAASTRQNEPTAESTEKKPSGPKFFM